MDPLDRKEQAIIDAVQDGRLSEREGRQQLRDVDQLREECPDGPPYRREERGLVTGLESAPGGERRPADPTADSHGDSGERTSGPDSSSSENGPQNGGQESDNGGGEG